MPHFTSNLTGLAAEFSSTAGTLNISIFNSTFKIAMTATNRYTLGAMHNQPLSAFQTLKRLHLP
jgi:hypothetical protein